MFLTVPKNGQFKEKFSKKIRQTFLLDGIFLWLMYMFEKAKGFKICKTILNKSSGAWECL